MNTTPPTVAMYAPDLMDASKIRAALAPANVVRRPDALVDIAADVIVVDLSRPGVLAALQARHRSSAGSARVIGFAPHVDDDTVSVAKEMGCEALPRSVFFRRLPTLLD